MDLIALQLTYKTNSRSSSKKSKASSRYQQSLIDLEALYGALSQQAFKGELDLSRVPLPDIQAEEEKTVAAEPLHPRAEQSLAINLPDTDNLLDALVSAEAREGLIAQWLEAYRGQLGSTPFSVQHFMAAVQTRLAELHPDNDFTLNATDYEHIKMWAFKALADGRLTQATASNSKLCRHETAAPQNYYWAGFRSLPSSFEHHFRTDWSLQGELAQPEGFAPFVCAGPNGSGKSNLLEDLAAIFFQLEILRVRRSFLPEVLQNADQDFSPMAFELDYLIRLPVEYRDPDGPEWAKVSVWKNPGESVRFLWVNQSDFDADINEVFKGGYADILLPQYVLGYSSGENEILSLPFFKLRFVQFDEYWNALTRQLSYPGHRGNAAGLSG